MKVDGKLLKKLEMLERNSNEKGISLDAAIEWTYYHMLGDMIKPVHKSEIRYITKEIYELFGELDRLCRERGYRTSDVIYRESGDLWENYESNTSSYVVLPNQSVERIKHIRNGMIQRCTNKNNKHYPSYGGRGIRVYSEWLHSAKSFVKWAELHGYEDYLTLDRINPYGDYEPSNCRWASSYTQANNKRESKKNKALPFYFQDELYSERMFARLKHLVYERFRNAKRTNSPMKSLLLSRQTDFWDRSDAQKILYEEKQLYENMDEKKRYYYDCLVRSCVENDADIYVVLKSLVNDIDKSMTQVRENKGIFYYGVRQ